MVAAVWGFPNMSWGLGLVLSPRYPNSFFDFVLPLLLGVGALLAVVGAVVAFVQQRRGTARRVSTRRERRTFAAIALALLALVILSGALHVTGLTAVPAEAEAGATAALDAHPKVNRVRVEILLLDDVADCTSSVLGDGYSHGEMLR